MRSSILSLLFIISFSYTHYGQDCTDGILNGDEVGIDCGGFYCPKCENENQVLVQNLMTHAKLGLTYDNGNNATIVAVDSSGSRAIISCANNGSSYNSVFTASTDGSEFYEIFDFVTQAPGSGWSASMIDISRDGSKVLWTTGKGGIYVSDFNGENRVIVADKLKNQVEDGGDLELETYTGPKFNADGTSIFFTHSKNGSKNRGIWEVGLNQSTATNQLMNIEDFSEAYTETIWNLGGIKHFYQLRITENNDIQFLTNLLQQSSFNADMMIYRDGNIELLKESALFASDINADQHTISKDGRFSFWLDPSTSNAVYFKLDHETNEITTIDLVKELNGVNSAKRIYSNYDGSLILISGTQSGGGSGQNVLVKENGAEYYPLHMAHGFLNNMSSIPAITLSEQNEKLVYTVGRGFPEPHEVWVTDVTPPSNNFDTQFPSLDGFTISNNAFVPGRLNNSKFSLSVNDGEQESVNSLLFSTFADDTLHLGYYLDPNQGTQLYDDGSSFGDAAIDNIYTHDDIVYSNQGGASGRELPYTFSTRFNLVTDNYITSYDMYPFFMVETISNNDYVLENGNIKIYPTLLDRSNRTLQIETDIPYKSVSYKILEISGKEVKSSGSISTLSSINLDVVPPGIYLLHLEFDDHTYIEKFVIGN